MVTTVVPPPRSERVSGSEIDTGASDDTFGRRVTTTCVPAVLVRTQSKVVAQLALLVAITVWHRSCSVAAEPLHH